MSKARQLAQKPTQPTGRKNLIINGAMNVAQRGTSFTNLANGSYGLDRFAVTKIIDGAVDILQTNDAPSSSESSYILTNCLHADVTTADTSIDNNDMYAILQKIEYNNISMAGFGTSGTRYLTASFWVKSTETGTFCCFIKTQDHTRCYVKEYSVISSDTWEHKTLTFPVDTSGGASWNDSDIGAILGWSLCGGTDYQIAADTWTTASNNYAPCTSNQVNALSSSSNNFKITGVQLEVGSVATEFEHRSYADELHMCKRYFRNDMAGRFGHIGNTSTRFNIHVPLEPAMRARPTVSLISGNTFPLEVTWIGNRTATVTAFDYPAGSTNNHFFRVYGNTTSTTTFTTCFIDENNNIEVDAEL